MDNFFSGIGIRPWDFIQISTGFVLAMLVLFGAKDKKYQWVRYLVLVVFGLQCLFFLLFHDGLQVKLFAALMLMSVLILTLVVLRREKRDRTRQPATRF